MDLAEHSGDYEHVNQLFKLVPRPDWTPLDQVKKLLRTKFVNRRWWGWDALGIGQAKRDALVKMQDEDHFMLKRYKNNRRISSNRG